MTGRKAVYLGETLMTIAHNTHANGALQSLGFQNSDGFEMTAGVVLPGEYDFGVAERREEIYVTHGSISVNGKTVRGGNRKALVFAIGEPIVFSVAEATTYIAYYS